MLVVLSYSQYHYHLKMTTQRKPLLDHMLENKQNPTWKSLFHFSYHNLAFQFLYTLSFLFTTWSHYSIEMAIFGLSCSFLHISAKTVWNLWTEPRLWTSFQQQTKACGIYGQFSVRYHCLNGWIFTNSSSFWFEFSQNICYLIRS